MWPDAPAFRAALARASRRLDGLAAAQGGSLGLGVALGASIALVLVRGMYSSTPETIIAGIGLGAIGLAIGATVAIVRRHGAGSAAAEIERRAPVCRNVVITADELLRDPRRVEPYIGEMVCRQAVRQLSALDLSAILPAHRALTALGSVSVVWAVGLAVVALHPVTPSRIARTGAGAAAAIRNIEIVVTPPSYVGRLPQTFRDASRVDALAGSIIHVTVQADAATVGIETLAGRQSLRPTALMTATALHAFTGEIVADADGFIAFEPSTTQGQPGIRRLVGLSVTLDHPPRVTITAPGKDMFLANPNGNIDVSIDANDDLGLASLALRYTRVSGSGEKFTFVDGDVPVSITRIDARAWKALGTLRLDPLKLEPGDMVVYRGVATDTRPGAPAVESDAFIVEITSPGMIASEGFALDDNEDKYALSQQMVILKTKRLIARSPSIPADSLVPQAQNVAAEQRAVRAQFVFMMGGELAEEVIAAAGMTDLNEEAEAAGEADIAAGRLANRGRVALVQAIRFMSRANASLNTTDLPKALTEEKAALAYLQQAFSRTRYLLRALTQRERLDLSRRLTGVLMTASPDSRDLVAPLPDPRAAALRGVLSGVAELAGRNILASNESAAASLLAQRVLAVDPSAESLQTVATDLNDAAVAIGRHDNAKARALLDKATIGLSSVLRRSLLRAPRDASSLDVRRLAGDLNDAVRRMPRGR